MAIEKVQDAQCHGDADGDGKVDEARFFDAAGLPVDGQKEKAITDRQDHGRINSDDILGMGPS
jgi:hypothetical protein